MGRKKAEIEEHRRVLSETPRYRYRARFTKSGRITWLGHLDLTRMLLRAMRRGRIPLVYSQGYNPKPRVGFSPALAVGVSSEAEYIDFESWDRLPIESTLERINTVLPRDVRFLALREIPRSAPSLGELIRAARYRAISTNGLRVGEALGSFRERGAGIVERKRKNGRMKIFELERELLDLEQVDDKALRLTLALHSDGPSVRPDEVLTAIFGEGCDSLRLVREELLAGVTDKLVNPMLVPTMPAGAGRPG